MSRRRKSTDTTPFDTLRLEGSLFVPELLERAANGEATFQKETDYAIPKGLKLHDEYGRAFRIATATWQSFATQTTRADLDAAAVTRAFVVDFLRQCLGYTDLAPLGAPIQLGDRGFPVTAQALGGRLPVIIAPHNLGLDDPDPRFAIIGSGSRKKSAHQLAQEFLNASPDSLWAIVTNGKTLRLLRDADTLTRPNFLEFDLETILRDDQHRYADFSALWRILHASRAGEPTATPTESIWEKWKSEGHAQGLRVRDGLRDGVTEAILILGRGFLAHPDNTVLRQRLHDGTLTLDDYFQQFFRLIYRCLFLFCTEERDLLHTPDSSPAARQAYATGYSLRRFRKRSLRQSAHDPHGDLWQSVRIVFRSLAHGQEKLALPALGGLFAETQCPDLDSASLSNRDLLSAMRELRWFFDKKTGKRSAIDYRNMGTEELGSVYESLLELVPTIDLPARTFGFVGITDAGSTSGNARKTTGSYYTADPLVMELIKSALEPVIRQRLADARELAASTWATVAARIATDSVQRSYVHAWLAKHLAVPTDSSPEAFARAWDAIPADARANPLCIEALLSITVCDPSCGSGHFLLAAARRLAETLAELRAPDGAVRPDDYRHALREVASRCLYGVDINPMAVELCRVALWLETVDPGKPLSFLNHHIRHGNSLLGTTPDLIAAGLPDETFTAIEGDDKPACAELKKRNKAERTGFGPLFAKEEDSIREKLRQAATSIEAMDDSQPDALQQKEAAFLTNETAPETRHAKLLADLWCAAFVIKKTIRSNDTPVVSSASQSPIPPPEDGQLLHTDDDLFGQPVPASKPTAKPKSSLKTENFKLGTASGITTGTLRDFVQGKHLPENLESEVAQLAEKYHFFHWHLAFPQVFDKGGFDCILGNPPWVRQETFADVKQLLSIWQAFSSTADLSIFFVELASTIIATQGRAGLLTPNKWLRNKYGANLRSVLSKTQRLELIVDFGHSRDLFPGADTFPALCIFTRATTPSEKYSFRFLVTNDEECRSSSISENIASRSIYIPSSSLQGDLWNLEDTSITILHERLSSCGSPLQAVLKSPIRRGVNTGFNEAFLIDENTKQALLAMEPECKEIIFPWASGSDVNRWVYTPSGTHLIFTRRGIKISRFPAVQNYLEKFREALTPKSTPSQTGPGRKPGPYEWYEIQDNTAYYLEFERPKILVPTILYYNDFAFVSDTAYPSSKVNVIPSDDLALLAVLNSSIMWWIMHRRFVGMKDDAISAEVNGLNMLPIPEIGTEDRQILEALVKSLISSEANTPHEKLSIELEINKVVNRLFRITDEESLILSNSAPPRDPITVARKKAGMSQANLAPVPADPRIAHIPSLPDIPRAAFAAQDYFEVVLPLMLSMAPEGLERARLFHAIELLTDPAKRAKSARDLGDTGIQWSQAFREPYHFADAGKALITEVTKGRIRGVERMYLDPQAAVTTSNPWLCVDAFLALRLALEADVAVAQASEKTQQVLVDQIIQFGKVA